MRVVRNDALIKKRVQFTQRGSLIGIGLLVISLVMSRNEQMIVPSWLALIGGFTVAMASVRIGNRYARTPRRDEVLDKLLKGLDARYTMYHYCQPAEHLLLTPSGLIAIRMQEQRGRVTVRGRRWRAPLGRGLRILLGEVGLGNPARDLGRELAATQQALGSGLGDTLLGGIIVFYSGKAHLDVQDAEYPVVLPEELRAAVRSTVEARPPLPGRRRTALAAALEGKEPQEDQPVEEAEPEPAPGPRSRKSARSRRARKT